MTGRQVPPFDLRKLIDLAQERKSEVDLHFSFLSITSFMLGVTAGVLLLISIVGDSIACLCPPQLSAAQCNYTKSWCRISPVLFIDFDAENPLDLTQTEKASRQKMGEYPLAPLVLILLAFCFKLPSFLWQECSDSLNKKISLRNGVSDDFADLIIFHRSVRTSKENRSRPLPTALSLCLQRVSACGLFVLGKRLGTYQTGLFMFTKLLSVCIVAGAFVMLASFMQTNVTWGGDFVHMRLTGLQTDFSFFSREVLCDVRVRQMTNVLTYTVQCVLPINMWNEKVFVALWFWLLFLLLLSISFYLFWFRRLLFSSSRQRFLRKLGFDESFWTETSGRANCCSGQNSLDFDTVLSLYLLESSYELDVAQKVAAKLRAKLKSRKTQ